MRVASPTATGSTPVARGSRVPVCPTRRVRSRRRTRRTTSWEVIPCGLSMSKIPFMSGQQLVQALENGLADLFECPFDHGAGGVMVAAAAQVTGQGANIDLTFGAHADLI